MNRRDLMRGALAAAASVAVPVKALAGAVNEVFTPMPVEPEPSTIKVFKYLLTNTSGTTHEWVAIPGVGCRKLPENGRVDVVFEDGELYAVVKEEIT